MHLFRQQKDRESARLCLLEDAFDRTTKTHLLGTGLKKGWRCLEIGPGAGSILKWIGKIVINKGLVVGLDENTKYIQPIDRKPKNPSRGRSSRPLLIWMIRFFLLPRLSES